MSPPPSHRLATATVVLLLLASAAVPAGAVQPTQTEPSLVVELDADGAARLTLTLAYDLSTDSERAAFEELGRNESARERVRAAFADRMRRVASAGERETGREMSVADPQVDLTTADDGSTGVVRLAITYDGLAAVEDGRLRVTAPFADGFQADRRVVVVGPEGYELTAASPDPAQRSVNRVTYAAGSNLDGFEVAFAPADGTGAPAGTNEGDSRTATPGFGVAAALAAALAAAALLARRGRIARTDE